MKRSWLRHMSNQYRKKVARRVKPRAQQLAQYPYCEAKRAGAPKECRGPLECHEPWTRARGGPIDDPRNMVTCCRLHNTNISQDADTQGWARMNGFIIHSYHGPAWLEAGGVIGTIHERIAA